MAKETQDPAVPESVEDVEETMAGMVVREIAVEAHQAQELISASHATARAQERREMAQERMDSLLRMIGVKTGPHMVIEVDPETNVVRVTERPAEDGG